MGDSQSIVCKQESERDTRSCPPHVFIDNQFLGMPPCLATWDMGWHEEIHTWDGCQCNSSWLLTSQLVNILFLLTQDPSSTYKQYNVNRALPLSEFSSHLWVTPPENWSCHHACKATWCLLKTSCTTVFPSFVATSRHSLDMYKHMYRCIYTYRCI